METKLIHRELTELRGASVKEWKNRYANTYEKMLFSVKSACVVKGPTQGVALAALAVSEQKPPITPESVESK